MNEGQRVGEGFTGAGDGEGLGLVLPRPDRVAGTANRGAESGGLSDTSNRILESKATQGCCQHIMVPHVLQTLSPTARTSSTLLGTNLQLDEEEADPGLAEPQSTWRALPKRVRMM